MLIAIIEDTPVNLVVMQSMVRRLGDHDCQVFSDSGVGLDWCIEKLPDLIVVDYMMPGMDGLEVIRRCRANEVLQNRPILMVTAASDREVRYAALNAGATDFLTKPIDKHEFIPRVRNMLQLRASMQSTEHRAEELAVAVQLATAEIHVRELDTVMRLAKAAEFRDPETGSHIQRMALFSELIARNLDLPAPTVAQILIAAPMHDIGKLGTPDYILLKPGKLTPEEFEIMKEHALIGHEILKNSSSPVLQMAAEIALTHHEKFNGSGYPNGTKGEDIPIAGRIVAVADVFDALTSARPYKPAWDVDAARQLLQEGRSQHFDPNCVDVFLAHWDEVLKIRAANTD